MRVSGKVLEALQVPGECADAPQPRLEHGQGRGGAERVSSRLEGLLRRCGFTQRLLVRKGFDKPRRADLNGNMKMRTSTEPPWCAIRMLDGVRGAGSHGSPLSRLEEI